MAGPEERLGPDEELVAGRRPVEEAFVARRGALRLLVVPQRRQALERIVLHATNLRIPIVEVEGGTLTALAGFDGHQGIGLVVRPRVWATIDAVLARAAERGEPPFVLVLDSLEDPQNFGTLLRSAEAAGVHGVIFPTHHQAPLSPAAVKASAGATEHLLLVPVDDLAASLADLHVRGLRVAGSEADAPLTAREADLRGPLALVVGSEGQGLGPAIRRRTDLLLRIPMRGAIGSLNASVAGSILLFEALEQRGLPDAPTGTAARGAFAEPSNEPTSPAEPAVEAGKLAAELDVAPAPVEPARRRTTAAVDAAPAPVEPPRRPRKKAAADVAPAPVEPPRRPRKKAAVDVAPAPADPTPHRTKATVAGPARVEPSAVPVPYAPAPARARPATARRSKAVPTPLSPEASDPAAAPAAAAPTARSGPADAHVAGEELLPGAPRPRRRRATPPQARPQGD